MSDQKTIDRVAVGLAELEINQSNLLFRKSTGRGAPSLNTPGELLCLHLGIPKPIPDWAKRALEEHQGTPEELVATLRELAGKDAETALCDRCGGPIERDGSSGEWEHVNTLALHKAKPKGEPE